jgi:hypothetical protein
MTSKQSDLLLQSLSAGELKKIVSNTVFQKGGFNEIMEDVTIPEEDLLLQSMPLSELRYLAVSFVQAPVNKDFFTAYPAVHSY